MAIHKVKIDDWEVCCDSMVTAIINQIITIKKFSDNDELYFFIRTVHINISVCPWCKNNLKD